MDIPVIIFQEPQIFLLSWLVVKFFLQLNAAGNLDNCKNS